MRAPAYVLPVAALLFLGSAFDSGAEVENLLGGDQYLVATDHSSPVQVGSPVHVHQHEQDLNRLEFQFSAGADSRYVSEGRDNLDGEGGIIWGGATGHVHALRGVLFAEVFGIQAWEANYQEVNLGVGYEVEVGAITLGAAVTYLWFPQEDGDDDDVELAVTGEWTSDSGVGLAAEAVWSTEAEGWFGEIQLFYGWEVCDSFTVTPSVLVGLNQGYVDDEHDGFNHLGLHLEGAVTLSENLETSLYVAFVEPLDDEPGESLRDLFWVGGAVTFTF